MDANYQVNQNSFVLDPDIIRKYTEAGEGYGFHRALDGDSEIVSYLPGSTLRLWLNKECVDYPIHWHPELEIIIPLENIYTVVINQTTYELHPGDIFFIPPGSLHSLYAPEDGMRIILLCDINVLNKINGFSFLQSHLSQPILMNRQNAKPIYQDSTAIITQMCRDYFRRDSLRDMVFYSRLLTLLTNYVRFKLSSDPTGLDSGSTRNRQQDLMEKMGHVSDYINEHLCDDLSLDAVSKAMGFSKFYFSRIFKEFTGYTYFDYLCLQRIHYAENLLANPDISITEIALLSGFTSLTTFNRTFKKIKDCTPSEYRKLFSRITSS